MRTMSNIKLELYSFFFRRQWCVMKYACDTKLQKVNKAVPGIKKEQSVVLPVTSILNGKDCGALVVDIC